MEGRAMIPGAEKEAFYKHLKTERLINGIRTKD